ncbi:MAG TPA: formate dehydrogenase accessory sulfurtransferase FdhD [Acidocella sp.]|nr:formate dehydrogenase accessory sulfurtransferase FdhD [Acidocella sp.]HQU04243.1 formate dehydrogenase accessory sulfurtransferase FdhD [Acidocella sp.]
MSWRGGLLTASSRVLPEETPVVLTYDHVSFAVMMATPENLKDFAVGFSLSEGIISAPSDITELEIVALETGIECRMMLTPAKRDALETRRRKIIGPVGCGLCGIDTLAQAIRPTPLVQSELAVSAHALSDAIAGLARLQTINLQTRAVHAAAFFTPATGDILLREDVGRHNALDKLIGAVCKNSAPPQSGVVLLTSRVSIELIQKTAMFGAPILVAISVPTARAVREAEAAGITLIAVARDDGFEVFSHPERIFFEEAKAHVA